MLHWWSPRLWGAHLLAAALIALMIWAGFWQLGVWENHRTDQVTKLVHGTPVSLDSLMRPTDAFPAKAVGKQVRIRGTWVSSATVYVEKAGGYWVVTPLATSSTAAVPVVRGWSRTKQAPASGTATDPATVTGWLQPADGPGATPVTGDVLPQLDIPDLIPRLSQNLYGAYVISEHPDAGLTQVTAAQLPAADPMTGLRNFLYAIEWWLFAVLVIYAWWKHVREQTAPAAPGSAAPQDAPVASAP